MVDKIDIKEKLIFLGFSTGIFLPVRLFVYNYISTWWFGSFGAISAIMILMLYLTKKEKLGYVGRIWRKQIYKISKGKLGVLVIIQSVIFIMIFAGIVYATEINRGSPPVEGILEGMKEQNMEFFDVFANDSELWKMTLTDWIGFGHFIINNPEIIGYSYALLDNAVDGWHQHFNMVWLIEEIEKLGLVLYFRYGAKIKNKINK